MKTENKQGSVLIISLIFIALLSVLSLQSAYYLNRKNQLLVVVKDEVVQTHLTLGILNQVINDMHDDRSIEGFDSLDENWIKKYHVKNLEARSLYRDVSPSLNSELRVHVQDESSRININTVDLETLISLLNALDIESSSGIAQNILSYRAQNGEMKNFQTVLELLNVPGVQEEDLLGEDINDNGYLNENENDGAKSFPKDNRNGKLELGLKDYLTVFTDGRININTANLEVLQSMPSMDQGIAEEIIEYREDQPILKLDDLKNISVITAPKFESIVRWATVKTDVYRVAIEAADPDKGQKNIVAVVNRAKEPAFISYYRED